MSTFVMGVLTLKEIFGGGTDSEQLFFEQFSDYKKTYTDIEKDYFYNGLGSFLDRRQTDIKHIFVYKDLDANVLLQLRVKKRFFVSQERHIVIYNSREILIPYDDGAYLPAVCYREVYRNMRDALLKDKD